MLYYEYRGYTLCSCEELPYRHLAALPQEGEVLYLFERPLMIGRDTFPVTDAALLTAEEGVQTLCAGEKADVPPELADAVAAGRVRAVNRVHPRWEELLAPLRRPEKYRVNLLALGDVGSTLLMGLRLMGGDVISSIGICDLREGVPERWEFELNQINLPGNYDALPCVEIVRPEQLFDGDVFLFCASRFVPDTAVKTGDVRMAQYALNRELAALYARKAREVHYKGLFCVVSDPVDPLCRAVWRESNRAEDGSWDGLGLFSHQVRGFGLGVMNARAAYYARARRALCVVSHRGAHLRPARGGSRCGELDRALRRRALARADGEGRPREPRHARDGLQALCGPGALVRGAEPAAVPAGRVELLVDVSRRRVHGRAQSRDAHGHRA